MHSSKGIYSQILVSGDTVYTKKLVMVIHMFFLSTKLYKSVNYEHIVMNNCIGLE